MQKIKAMTRHNSIEEKRKKQISARQTEVEGLVHSSSDKVRQFLIGYILVLAYVAAIVLSTTDRQLLLVDEGLKLPLIDLKVPMLGFYLSAPFLILSLHFNLLQNLAHHHIKLMAMRRAFGGYIPPEHINAFIFDVAAIGQPTPYSRWVVVVNDLVCLYSGPAVLSLVLWRFADYQSIVALCLHVAALWLDLVFIAKARQAFMDSPNLASHEPPFWYMVVKELSLAPILARPRQKWLMGPWWVFLIVITLKILVCWDVFVRDWEDSFIRRYASPSIQSFDEPYGHINDLYSLIPRIAIERTDWLFKGELSQLKAQAEIVQRRNWLSEFENRGMSIDLRGRSLRYLSIPYQVLPRLWAQEAQLQGANLSFAVLTGSVLGKAQLQGAVLQMTQLDGAYLNEANFRGANLANADLSGSYAPQTQFQAADLRGSLMRGMLLMGAGLQGSDLDGAQLEGSFVDGMQTWGVNGVQGELLVLSQEDGSAATLESHRPMLNEIQLWTHSLAGSIEEDSFQEWVNSDVANSSFAELRVDNLAAVRVLVKATCDAKGRRSMSRIALKRMDEFLTVLNHVARHKLYDEIKKKPNCSVQIGGDVTNIKANGSASRQSQH